MAKRQRGSSTRPGQRPPTTRSSARPATSTAATPRPASLTEDELERAAALEAAVVAEERQAAATVARNRDRRKAASEIDVPRTRARTGALAAIAAEEYIVVRHDLRRIAVTFALIFALLLASFVIIQTLGIAQPPVTTA